VVIKWGYRVLKSAFNAFSYIFSTREWAGIATSLLLLVVEAMMIVSSQALSYGVIQRRSYHSYVAGSRGVKLSSYLF